VKGNNESDVHYELKRAALRWLFERGARTIAFEVSVRTRDFSHVKVDVAAHDDHPLVESYRGPRGGWHRRKVGVVDELLAVECKASRADFFRDGRVKAALLDALAELDREREILEGEIREREPHLRVRCDLFSDETAWHYDRSADPRYARLRRRIDALSHRLHRGTKLETLRDARLFDRHYLCIPAGLLRPAELPGGWGLLEVPAGGGAARLVRDSEPRSPSEATAPEVIRKIARAGTWALLRSTGILSEPEGEDRQGTVTADR